MSDKTKEHEALLSIQDLINNLPEDRMKAVYMYAEDMRDILTEGQGDAFLALTLVACEFSATNAEMEKEETANDQIVAG